MQIRIFIMKIFFQFLSSSQDHFINQHFIETAKNCMYKRIQYHNLICICLNDGQTFPILIKEQYTPKLMGDCHENKTNNIQCMDREIPIINRVVDKKIQEFRSRKHRQTLSQIKQKSGNMFCNTIYQETPKMNRYSSSFIESTSSPKAGKNLQIERQNIKLFNREKPKLPIPNLSLSHTSEDPSQRLKKQSERIKTENLRNEKRIQEQKPTIQNKQFFKDRQKNIKYLKQIGRFPYQPSKRTISQSMDNNTNRSLNTQGNNDTQLYRNRTKESLITIIRTAQNTYIFNIEMGSQGSENYKTYTYCMTRKEWEMWFMRCGYSYEKIIQGLRVCTNGEVVFVYLNSQLNQEAQREGRALFGSLYN